MAEFEFEPGETETLRHAPGWVDLLVVGVILLIEFAILAAASQEITAQPMRYDQATLAAVIVITLFAGAGGSAGTTPRRCAWTRSTRSAGRVGG